MKMRSWKRLIAGCLFILGFVLTSAIAIAQTNDLDIYFFYSKTCPHCAKEKPFLEYIDRHNDNITVHSFEVNESSQKWQEFRDEYEISSGSVPRTLIGDTMFIGYSDAAGPLEYVPMHQGYIGYRNQMVNAIEQQVEGTVNLPGDRAEVKSNGDRAPPRIPWSIFLIPAAYIASYPLVRTRLESEQLKRYWVGGLIASIIVSVFLWIALIPDAIVKQFASDLPFPLFVSVLALADGFNPCAFTVLIILLSLLTHTKRRADMTLVGTTFIATSAVMYFIFIMMMVLVGSVFIEKYGTIIMAILGGILTIVGLINIKDYFFFKRAVSFSLSEQQQQAVAKRSGKIVQSLRNAKGDRKVLFAAIGGTIVLAIFVNIIELGCTAILPVVYMTSLVKYCSENVAVCYVGWTALYALLYVVPLFAILFNFIYSFKSVRMTEQQGRRLKLVGGLLMLAFGQIMLFKPDLLMFV